MKNPKIKPINFFDEDDTKKFHPKTAYTEAKNINDENIPQKYEFQQPERTNKNDDIKPKYIGRTTIGKGKQIPERKNYQNQQDDDNQHKEFKKKIKGASVDAKKSLNENIETTAKKIAKKKKARVKKTAKKKKRKHLAKKLNKFDYRYFFSISS